MFKKFIKKHNKKIIAFIGVLTTTICGVLGITKTYAYSTNVFSSTLSNPTETSDSTFLNSSTYESDGYVDFRVNNRSGYITYVTFDLLENDLPSNFQYSNYIFIINCAYLNTGNVVENTSSGQAIYICQGATTTSIISKTTYMRNYITKNNISYKCVVQGLDNNDSVSTSTGKITIGYRGSQYQSSDTNWQGIRIYNIDILKSEELYTSNYIEDIENQYNNLLDDYNTLESNYDTLQDNYDTLESDYNDLQDNYETLNEQYQTLEGYGLNQAFINSFNGATIKVVDKDTDGTTFYTSTIQNFNKSYFDLERDATDVYQELINNNYNGMYLIIELVTYYNTSFTVNFPTLNGSIETWDEVGYSTWQPIESKNVHIENSNTLTMNTQMYNFNRLDIGLGYTGQFNVIISTNSIGDIYMQGYRNGFTSIDNQTKSLEDQITQMQLTINSLREQLNAHTNDYNLNNLIWTIGGTPFESFKHIWNVNFFGVNIADFILGFVTTFIGLYIFKKFFF